MQATFQSTHRQATIFCCSNIFKMLSSWLEWKVTYIHMLIVILTSPTCVCLRVMIFYYQLRKQTDRLVVACSHAPHTTCAVSAFYVAASIYSTILDLNTAGRNSYVCFNQHWMVVYWWFACNIIQLVNLKCSLESSEILDGHKSRNNCKWCY